MNDKHGKSEQTVDAYLERKLFRHLVLVAEAFSIDDGQVVSRPRAREGEADREHRELFASRFGKLLALAATLLPQMSHKHFARYVPGIAVLGTVARPLQYEPADLRIRTASRVTLSRLKAAQKEPWTVSWIEESLGPDEVFYDIGANIGAYSLIAARAGGDSARVFAFEPSFTNYAELVHNIASNGLAARINALPVVLTDHSGLVSFQYLGLDAGGAQHGVDTPPLAGAERQRVEPVLVQQLPGFRLDDFREQFEIPQPHHVKIDVDGHELAVLAGGSRTWAAPELRSLMIETEGAGVLAECESLLAGQAGLRLADRWERPAVTYSLFRRD